jgi:multiple sugar transport system substrate-binding protein
MQRSILLDHPYMGLVAREKCFLPLYEFFTRDELQELSRDSVGQSYLSYCFEGHQWALPLDAAAQVAGYRADLLQANGFNVPRTWEQVAELAKFRRGFVTPAHQL